MNFDKSCLDRSNGRLKRHTEAIHVVLVIAGVISKDLALVGCFACNDTP